MKTDKYYGDGLTRLADPKPIEWLKDFTQIMITHDLYGWTEPGYTGYGNFWAKRVCRVRRHHWSLLDSKPIGPTLFHNIYRCQRCGSQIAPIAGYAFPPTRGEF